jgi:two-component SAPR family response regulator
MPEMSAGSPSMRQRRPEIRTLFMSGYAHSASSETTVHGELLKKPFAPEQLTRAVRATLDDDHRLETA